MKIYYGITNNVIDVTDICFERLINNNIITIPFGDINRAYYFTDPIVGVHKSIFIENFGITTEYNEYIKIKINTLNNTIETINKLETDTNLQTLQLKLKLNYGSFRDEYPEQRMSFNFLNGNEKVLEIGGNIGRNSLIIASLLNDSSNLVSLESDNNIAKQLTENRDLNNLNFNIEPSALSKRKLIQKDWDTIPSDVLLDGYSWINTITLEQLKKKYNINFDTLILDCEGAFYYILMDMPEILNNINLIIMENDYHDINHKNYIDEILKSNNFYTVYQEAGGWGPCFDKFFEVWKR